MLQLEVRESLKQDACSGLYRASNHNYADYSVLYLFNSIHLNYSSVLLSLPTYCAPAKRGILETNLKQSSVFLGVYPASTSNLHNLKSKLDEND